LENEKKKSKDLISLQFHKLDGRIDCYFNFILSLSLKKKRMSLSVLILLNKSEESWGPEAHHHHHHDSLSCSRMGKKINIYYK